MHHLQAAAATTKSPASTLSRTFRDGCHLISFPRRSNINIALSRLSRGIIHIAKSDRSFIKSNSKDCNITNLQLTGVQQTKPMQICHTNDTHCARFSRGLTTGPQPSQRHFRTEARREEKKTRSEKTGEEEKHSGVEGASIHSLHHVPKFTNIRRGPMVAVTNDARSE